MSDYEAWASRYADYYASPAELANGYEDYLNTRDELAGIFATAEDVNR